MFQLLTANDLLTRPSLWETIDHANVTDDFPILTEEEIGDITLGMKSSVEVSPLASISISGVFQLKRARAYVEENTDRTESTGAIGYTIQRCRLFPNIIRAPTQSAHKNRKTYHPTVQFSEDEILGWWCDCPIGNRIIGCCSHVSSVIWFLSYERWQSTNAHRRSTITTDLFQDALTISDFYDSSDDEDSRNDRYSLL